MTINYIDLIEKLSIKVNELEREIKRLQIIETPTSGSSSSGVTDHGALSGLADNDHPQYLLTTGKAADSDKLDGLDSTGFATASHNHDTLYVGLTGTQTIAGAKTFSTLPTLATTTPTTNQAVRRGFADETYLGISAKATDSDKLNNQLASYYASASSIVTDHGNLAGLSDDDHPQYSKVADFEDCQVSAYRDNTTFTLTTSGTIYSIPLNQESYDTHGFHSNTTNPERFTCQKAGTYVITGQVSFAANATGNRDTLIRVNGTDYVGQMRLPAAATGSTSVPVTAIVKLALNDYVELCGRQYSGGSLNLYYANSISNYMTMVMISEVSDTTYGKPVFCNPPLTKTGYWRGEARSSSGPTVIDLSETHGVPEGVKAVALRLVCRDSATFGTNNNMYVALGPTSSYYYAISAYPIGGDFQASSAGITPCDSSGNIYYRIQASGTETMDVWIEVWAYWL